MFNKLVLFPLLALLLFPLGAHAASSSNQEQDYEQVRKIALRDAKVRAAYAEADRKLEARILQIDPTLAPYLRRRAAGNPTALKPASTAKTPVAKPFRRAHTVAKGDTLGSLAVKYGVSVAALKATNRITDEKKLPVGQVLAIPNPPGR
jgi:LysM repeat protein